MKTENKITQLKIIWPHYSSSLPTSLQVQGIWRPKKLQNFPVQKDYEKLPFRAIQSFKKIQNLLYIKTGIHKVVEQFWTFPVVDLFCLCHKVSTRESHTQGGNATALGHISHTVDRLLMCHTIRKGVWVNKGCTSGHVGKKNESRKMFWAEEKTTLINHHNQRATYT